MMSDSDNNEKIPLSPEESRHWRLELAASLRAVPREDLVSIISAVPTYIINAFQSVNGRNIDSRRITVERRTDAVLTAVSTAPQEIVSPIFAKLMEKLLETFDEATVNNPTKAQFDQIVESLLENWPETLVRALLCTVVISRAPACDFAEEWATEHPLAVAAEVAQVEKPIINVENPNEIINELPDITRDIYTPFGKALIKISLDVAFDIDGAPDREEFQLLLDELAHLNHSHMPTWFQIGFASGLNLIPTDYLIDGPAVNPERRLWHHWGRIKGLIRREAIRELQDLLVSQDRLTMDMIDSDLGSDCAVEIIKNLLQVRHSLAIEILESKLHVSPGRPIQYEIELAKIVDDISVEMLRQEKVDLATDLIQIAQNRIRHVAHVMPHEISHVQGLNDLKVRLSLGRAAAFRRASNYDAAITELRSVSDIQEDQVSDRTRARYLVQRVLSNARVQRIENVEVPRNDQEAQAFFRKYQSLVPDLDTALALYPGSGDALYIKLCIDIANNDYVEAQNRIGNVRDAFDGRGDRKHLIPLLHLAQIRITLMSGGNVSVSSAIDDLISSLPPGITLRSSESDLIIERALETESPQLEGFLEWLNDESNRRHGIPSMRSLSKVWDVSPNFFVPILGLAKRTGSLVERLDFLTQLLNYAIRNSQSSHIDLALEAIEDLLREQTPSIYRAWAETCSGNSYLREYLGALECDLMAIDAASHTNDDNYLCGVISQAIDRVLPVHNISDQANVNILVEELQTIDPMLAELYRSDKLSQPIPQYVPWHSSPESNSEEFETIQITFVGGMQEIQGGFQSALEQRIEGTYKGKVTVTWFYPGWKSRWEPVAANIEATYDKADAVVLMPLVRTNFGRRIRRTSGENGVPWVPCTGHGQGSIFRSICEAVNVSVSRNRNR